MADAQLEYSARGGGRGGRGRQWDQEHRGVEQMERLKSNPQGLLLSVNAEKTMVRTGKSLEV